MELDETTLNRTQDFQSKYNFYRREVRWNLNPGGTCLLWNLSTLVKHRKASSVQTIFFHEKNHHYQVSCLSESSKYKLGLIKYNIYFIKEAEKNILFKHMNLENPIDSPSNKLEENKKIYASQNELMTVVNIFKYLLIFSQEICLLCIKSSI